MSDILTRERVNVQQGKDLVRLQLGDRNVLLYYQTAFAILQGMRVAAKAAMVFEGNKIKKWREFANDDIPPSPAPVPLHHEYRRSGNTSNLKKWNVSFGGALVILRLDDLTVKFHYSDAFYLQAWMRLAAKQAKRWAGDSTKSLRATAHLTDAEENYKYGLG